MLIDDLNGYYTVTKDNQNQITVDATCYESEVRYPTAKKLLWEAVDWLYKQLKSTCKVLGIKMMRCKYIKWKKRYIGFSKMRRKTNKKRKPLTRSLIHLLGKLIKFEALLRKQHRLEFTINYYRRVATIKKIQLQQFFCELDCHYRFRQLFSLELLIHLFH